MENTEKSLEFEIVRSRLRPRAIFVYRASSTDALRDAEYLDPAFLSRASCKKESTPRLSYSTNPLGFHPTCRCYLAGSCYHPSPSFSKHRRVSSPTNPQPPPVHRKRRWCIFRREARGNFGTLTPEAGFWMVGLDTTRPLT